MSFEMSALLVTWLAILLLALVVSGLIRQVHGLSAGRMGLRPGDLGVAVGTRAPELARLRQGQQGPGTLLLLFLSEDCGVCDAVLEEAVAAAGPAAEWAVKLHAVFPGSAPPRALASADAGIHVWQDESSLFERYKIAATPFGVAVDDHGTVVRSEPVGSTRALRDLLMQASGDKRVQA